MSSDEEPQNDDPTTALRQVNAKTIANVLTSEGPIVTGVMLKAADVSEVTLDSKSHHNETNGCSSSSNNKEEGPVGASEEVSKSRLLLKEYMEEIKIDTTPSKCMVSKVLGGPFTSLGQYDSQGIVLMIQRLPVDLDPDELTDLKLSQLRDLCHERDISLDDRNMVEKSDLIHALNTWSTRKEPRVNPHTLQPPLHNTKVRGDILILKVAHMKEEFESWDEDTPPKKQEMDELSNKEFFLNYSLQEYLNFASRSDIPEHTVGESDEETKDKEEVDDSDESNDEGVESGDESPWVGDDDVYRLGEDDEVDDEDKFAMFNMVMNEYLRQYRRDNDGKGPDTLGLLEIRAAIAEELGVRVSEFDPEQADWSRLADGTPARAKKRKIGFHQEDTVLEYEPHPNEHNRDDDQDEDDPEPQRKRLKTGPPSREPPEEEEEEEEEVEDSKLAARASSGSSTSSDSDGS